MRERRSSKSKRGCKWSTVSTSVGVLLAIAIVVMAFAVMSVSVTAQEAEVEVRVNAPEMVKEEETFDVTIDVDSIMEFNSGQFDLSFDSGVVNVTGVADGSIDGETIPVDSWAFVDEDTIAVILEIKGIKGVSGSGNLAKISFEVVGEGGDRSVLDISDGMLVDTEAEEIPAEWIDDEVIVKSDKPSVTIETDKPVYEPCEKQIIALTIANPTSEPVQAKLGVDFHVYEIEGSPYSYDVDIFETELIWLPAGFEKSFAFPVKGLELPEGKYAWSAYLKDAKGVKIAESEAKFSIVASYLFTAENAENTESKVNYELQMGQLRITPDALSALCDLGGKTPIEEERK